MLYGKLQTCDSIYEAFFLNETALPRQVFLFSQWQIWSALTHVPASFVSGCSHSKCGVSYRMTRRLVGESVLG